MQYKLPNFLCIGMNKAGTSWLFWQLKKHPEIWMGRFKEAHFFDQKWLPKKRKMVQYHMHNNLPKKIEWILKHKLHENTDYFELNNLKLFSELLNYNYLEPLDLEWYKKVFLVSETSNNYLEKIIGDITPDYFCLPLEGIIDIKRTLGKIPVLLIVRDPVERCLSQLRMNIERGRVDHSIFSHFNWKEFFNDNKNVYEYFDIASLNKYLPLWIEVFGDSFFCLPYGMIKTNPKIFMQDIEKKLQINKHPYKNLDEKIFSSKKTDYPNELIEFLKGKLNIEYTFLEKNFSREFISQI